MKGCSFLFAIFLVALFLSFVPFSLFAKERVALVIGNNDYPVDSNFPDLKNCINDATLIGETLRSVGFDVIEVHDADLSTMEEALERFEGRVETGGTALVYYAGHGIEYDGKNYLMATNAEFKSRSRLTREAIKAEVFAAAMVQAGAKSSFLLLDCCRELPTSADWAGRGQKKFGLGEISIDGDILISMAASPGKQALEPNEAGGNSPYARALAKWIPSGDDHLNLFQRVRKDVYELTEGQQRTWENGSFLELFYFTKNPEKESGKSFPDTGSVQAKQVENQAKMNSKYSIGGQNATGGDETVVGKYKKSVTSAISQKWHIYREKNKEFVKIGLLKVTFDVFSDGSVRNLKVVENNVNAVLAEFSLRAILEAEIPPMPSEVSDEVGDIGLGMKYDIIIY